MAKVPKIRTLHIYAISPEKHGVEVVLLRVTRLAQSTQNSKFAIPLQYLKENGKNEVNFLLADKHQKFLKNDTIILGVCGQACPNYPK